MKWRWLAVVAMSVLLGGCANTPCPVPAEVNTNATPCYYLLTITKVGPESGEAKGRVAQSVVEADRERYYFSLFRPDVKDYDRSEYLFHVQNSDFVNLKNDTNYLFVSEPISPVLKVCTTDECNKAKLEYDKPY
jgi:hypothetical protein